MHTIDSAPADRNILLRYAGPPHEPGEAFWIEGWWLTDHDGGDWETAIGFIGQPTHWAEVPK